MLLNKTWLVVVLEQLIDGWLTEDDPKLQLTNMLHQVPFIFVPVDDSTPPNENGPAFSYKESSVISPLVALLLFSHFLFPLLPSETYGFYALFQFFFSFSLFFRSGKYMLRFSVVCSSLPPCHRGPF